MTSISMREAQYNADQYYISEHPHSPLSIDELTISCFAGRGGRNERESHEKSTLLHENRSLTSVQMVKNVWPTKIYSNKIAIY